jgi:signal transduction histidine kinase/DNA-binding response OmpR family regulator/streptogramin lyase
VKSIIIKYICSDYSFIQASIVHASKTLTLLALFVLLQGVNNSFLKAQDFVIQTQHFGIEEGLSHRDVQCIHQDKNGVMWLGTRYGLNRYDGYNFRWFTQETNDLQSNHICHILERPDSMLWLFKTDPYFSKRVQTIDVFDPITEKSLPFEDHFRDQVPFDASAIQSFDANNRGDILFLAKDHRLFLLKDTFRLLFRLPLPARWNTEIRWATAELMWLRAHDEASGNAQLILFDLKGNALQQINHENTQGIRIYQVDSIGTCRYFTTNAGLGEAPKFYQATLDGQNISDAINQDRPFTESVKGYFRPHEEFFQFGRQYWYEKVNGLHIYDAASQRFFQNGIDFEGTDLMWAVHLDNTGAAWVGAAFGLTRLQFKENHFSTLSFREGDLKLAARAMCLDDNGNLWVVPEGRRMLWKVGLNGAEVVDKARYRYDETPLPIPSNFLAISRKENGALLYGVENQLVSFDPNTFEYHSIPIDELGDDAGFIWVVYEDEYGKLWFGNSKGKLGYWDGQKVKFVRFTAPPSYSYYFHKTKDGKTWLATDNGFYVLNMEEGKVIEHYWPGGTGKYHFPYHNIYHFHEEADGTFWIATGGAGLIKWERTTTGEIAQFTRAHGLNNTIYAVYEDEFGYLWLPSDLGIIRFDKKSQQVISFLEEDGLSNNEFNRISHHQAPDGRLFFGSLDGVTIFDPADFQAAHSNRAYPLVISDFQQFDENGQQRARSKQLLYQENEITFNPDDRYFRIDFALLTYEHVGKNRYAYKIEGIDKDWSYQKENFLRFTSLPYGKYQLRIKGQSADGQWSEQELHIQLNVLKPFYLTGWFILTALMTALLLIFVLYKRRTNELERQRQRLEAEVARQTQEIRQQAEELKSLEKLKSRFFANVSHELRTPLTLMLGPMDTLLKREYWNKKDRSLMHYAHKNGKQLLKLVNEILDLSKLESNRLEFKASTVNFFQFLQPLVAQFSSFGDSESVQLTFDYRANQDLVLQLDTDKFEKIVHNYLSNALKFTPKDKAVELIIEELEGDILLQVSDTGKGIHPNDLPYIFDRFYQSKQPDAPVQGGTGIGLSLCKELAGLLGGKVWVSSELGRGSTFFFQFPKKLAEPQQPPADSSPAHLAPIQLGNKEPLSKPSGHPKKEITDILANLPVVQTATTDSGQTSLLVVEDNADLRDYLRSILEEDFQITTAENGQIAWGLLSDASNKYDLIVSDLMMPVMNGFELLEKVKRHDALRHLPFIMLTARADVRVKLQALRVGVDDYLVKPFLETELKIRIKNLLGNLQERLKAFVEEAPLVEGRQAKESQPESPVIGEADAEWLQSVEQILEQSMAEAHFTQEWVAQRLFISKRQFHRKLKKLTGLTPNLYLREMRLQKAREYLYRGTYHSVKEVATAVGFADSKYFSKLFQERFGILPSERLA